MSEEPENSILRYLADQASSRYYQYLPEIERIKSGIKHNREGQLPLTEITNDENRKNLRFTRAESNVISSLERVNGVPNFQDISIIKKITDLSVCVCRIITKNSFGSSAFGTGFLVAPGILMTNNHVIPTSDIAYNSNAQFNYEISNTGMQSNPVNFKLRPDKFFMTSEYKQQDSRKFSGLDFTLVAVDDISSDQTNIAKFGFGQLDAGVGKILEGENCVIIQHPKGDYKKIVLKDIRMITLMDDFILYESDTLPGSSGSMVLGLGTGEIVALHHSAVPRKDAHGNWLKKDGTLVTDNDRDHDIDWIGNEGIRISRILKAVNEMPVDPEMEKLKQLFLGSLKNQPVQVKSNAPSDSSYHRDTPLQNFTAGMNGQENETIGFFEIQLINNPILQKDWEENIQQLVPGCIKTEQLFKDFTDKNDPKLYYLECKIGDNSWGMAEKIEELPHVAFCTPDEPIPTDGMLTPETGSDAISTRAIESAVYTRGYAKNNENQFLNQWRYAYWIKELKADKKKCREWNRHAVGLEKKIDSEPEDWQEIIAKLSDFKLVQLDTGFSSLSKIQGGIDFTLDYDFIDRDHSAEDELKKVGFKHPFHGTRTASIVIGGQLKHDHENQDGNRGILTNYHKGNNKSVPIKKVIPYRVANSVVLLGRTKHVLSAVQHAVMNDIDVMFMCMGTLPSPALDKAARVAYENGIIWVCAGGNEVEFVVAPASYPGTIAVAATNPDDEPWDGTSYGKMIDISAPGERIYVPFLDKHKNEIMVFGDGTSYATPHVASAAMLWKAKYGDKIKEKYKLPWQVVEAFRYCLKLTARRDFGARGKWNSEYYGDGILDINGLLSISEENLPNAEELGHAYKDQDWPAVSNSSTIQAFRHLWKGLIRKLNPWEPQPFESMDGLTSRGQDALEALQRATESESQSPYESASASNDLIALDVFRQYTEHYDRNQPKLRQSQPV